MKAYQYDLEFKQNGSPCIFIFLFVLLQMLSPYVQLEPCMVGLHTGYITIHSLRLITKSFNSNMARMVVELQA